MAGDATVFFRDNVNLSDVHSNVLVLGGEVNGLILAAILFGVISYQTSAYFRSFKDNRTTQALVLALVALQIATIGHMAFCLYTGVIRHVGDSALGVKILLRHIPIVFVCGLAQSVMVQSFFMYRIWTISKSSAITALVTVPVAIQMGFGISLVVLWTTGSNHDVSQGCIYIVFLCWLIAQIVTDFGIASLMSLLLLGKKADIRATNSLLNKLIVFTMSTGAISGVFSIIFAIMLRVSANSRSYLVIMVSAYGGVYPLAMLSNLHTRTCIRKWEMKLRNPHQSSGPRAVAFSKDIDVRPTSRESQTYSKRIYHFVKGSISTKSGSGTLSSASRMNRSSDKSEGIVINVTRDRHTVYADDIVIDLSPSNKSSVTVADMVFAPRDVNDFPETSDRATNIELSPLKS